MLVRFTMVSKSFSILMLSIILRCKFAFSVDEPELDASKNHCETSSVPVSELFTLFRNEHSDLTKVHLTLMFLTASYGDRLYNLSADLSADCRRTAKAHSLMLGKVAFCSEAFEVQGTVMRSLEEVLRTLPEPKEHPLELMCREIVSQYAKEPS